jgi:hypothetical protein
VVTGIDRTSRFCGLSEAIAAFQRPRQLGPRKPQSRVVPASVHLTSARKPKSRTFSGPTHRLQLVSQALSRPVHGYRSTREPGRTERCIIGGRGRVAAPEAISSFPPGSERDRPGNSTGVVIRELESFSRKSRAWKETLGVSLPPQATSPKTERTVRSAVLTQIPRKPAGNAKRREGPLSAFAGNSWAASARGNPSSSPTRTRTWNKPVNRGVISPSDSGRNAFPVSSLRKICPIGKRRCLLARTCEIPRKFRDFRTAGSRNSEEFGRRKRLPSVAAPNPPRPADLG